MKLIKKLYGLKKKHLLLVIIFLTCHIVYAQTAIDITAFSPSFSEALVVDRVGLLEEDLFAGAATYNLPIEVPRGAVGMQPSVKLIYDSHFAGQTQPNILGKGWSINEFYITRNAFPQNNLIDNFQLVWDGGSHDLVYIPSEGKFHTEIETFFSIENKTGGNNTKGTYWVLRDNEGKSFRFGYNEDSEYLSNNNQSALRWYLDKATDIHGNYISYTYIKNPTINDINAIYPYRINYNNDEKKVIEFILESTDRPDKNIFYSGEGNKVRYSRRIIGINISFDNKPVRRYVFGYNDSLITVSLLKNITIFGSDSSSSLSSFNLDYFGVEKDWTDITNNWNLPQNASEDADEYFAFNLLTRSGRIVDINRDGLLDYVTSTMGYDTNTYNGSSYQTTASHRNTFINNGSGWIKDENLIVPIEFEIQRSELDLSNAGNPDVSVMLQPEEAGGSFAELNGDGLKDLVRLFTIYNSTSDFIENITKVWFNNGSGWEDQTQNWNFPPDVYFNDGTGNENNTWSNSRDLATRIVDINNDGLDDLVVARKNIVDFNDMQEVFINNGSGWYNSAWDFPSQIYFLDTSWIFGNLGTQFADVNGDSLVDIVRLCRYCGYSPESRRIYKEVWLNNGSGWFNDTANWNIPENLYFIKNSSASLFTVHEDTGLRMGDINSDGLTDFILSYDNSSLAVQKIYLNNGSGWNEDSWSLPQEAIFKLNISWVGSGNEAGLRLADVNGDGVIDLVRFFDCRTSCIYNELKKVWINKAVKPYLLKSVTNEYGGKLSLDYKSSTLLRNLESDSPGILGFNIWVIANVTEDNGLVGSQSLITTRDYDYEGGLYEYNESKGKGFRGFAKTTIIDTGTGVKTIHSFHQTNDLKGRKFREEINNTQDNPFQKTEFLWSSTNQDNYYIVNLNSESTYAYDGSASNPKVTNITYSYDSYGNIISKNDLGDISQSGDERYETFEFVYNTVDWIVNKVKHYELRDSDDTTKLRETKFYYDELSYGASPTKGDLTKVEEILSGSTPTITYSYDSYGNVINETNANGHITQYIFGLRDTTNTFVDRMINAKGQVTDYNYDVGTGNLLSETDHNDFLINYTYDVFGRIKTEIRPYDSTAFPTKEYEYTVDGTAPEKIKIMQREESGAFGTFDSYYYYDGFGRLIQTKTEAENSEQIVHDIYYDELGRLTNQSNPYFRAATTDYSVPNSSINKVSYTYDPLDRVTKITNPDGTQRTINFDHWKVTVTDENSHIKDYFLDAFGQIIKVQEINGNNAYNTSYDYDAAGQLLTITDVNGNVWTYTYDKLGRRTSQDDPDVGNWIYAYDDVGNILTRTAGTGRVTSLSYDELNRITKENTTNENITYVYDRETIGTLSEVKTLLMTQNYSYDQRLRKINENKDIGGLVFTTSWTYDASDRVKSKGLPNGDSINFTYNDQGQLNSVSDILTNIDYDVLNRPKSRAYGNSLTSTFTFNQDTQRVSSIATGSLQSLSYTYDNAGNVESITDNINSKVTNAIYDDLDRLASVGHTDYTANYTYDALGNMLNISYNGDITVFNYTSTQPIHAPKAIQEPNVGPVYSNIMEFPTDPTINYSFNAKYSFNITWTDDVSVNAVTLEFDGTNYTDVSQNGNIYGREFTNLAVGTHTYRWYATDGSKTSNTSALSYSVEDGIHAFEFINSTGGIVAWFGHLGHLVLTGAIQQNSNYLIATDDLFVIRNSGEDVFIIAKNGTIYIDGILNQNQTSLSSSESSNDFRIRNSSSLVSYVNNTGDLFLTRELIENVVE